MLRLPVSAFLPAANNRFNFDFETCVFFRIKMELVVGQEMSVDGLL